MTLPRDFFNERILCDEDYDFAEDVELKALDLGWKITSQTEPLQKSFYFLQTLSSEDKMLWECIKEMLAESIKTSEMSVVGSFEIRLVFIRSLEIQAFDIANLARLISNHANHLSYGESRIFPYSSMWFQLKKLSPLDWGKIKFSHQLYFFNEDRSKLDLLLKKMSKPSLADDKASWVILDDLSRSPLFRFGEDPQTERLFKWVKGLCDKAIPNRVQIRLGHCKNNGVDLFKQFEVSSEN